MVIDNISSSGTNILDIILKIDLLAISKEYPSVIKSLNSKIVPSFLYVPVDTKSIFSFTRITFKR